MRNEISKAAPPADADGRRQSLALPNGVSMNYGYDAASQLTGITYKLGATTLGNLTYTYDLAGRRTGVGGSYARTNVPQTVSSAAYNVNNQLSNWKGTNFTYDANGNLANDGANTYTWNARNQLVSISGAVSASFQYDAFGRRVSKTIGATTQFLYDGANPVQEISGTSVSANLLTGGIDEYFQRTDSAGARSFFTDALGSTLALADSTGTVQTSYSFEPFGNTTTTGGTTTNSFAYTGRELDTTGLYFYRARYYSPGVQRFIAEDPLEFQSGDTNLYSYTRNSAPNYTDAGGTTPFNPFGNTINWSGLGAAIGNLALKYANYIPAICSADSFRFTGGGGGSENIQGGVYKLDDVHYSNTSGEGWHPDGIESSTLVEAFGEDWGGGVVISGRKPKEALLFPPSPYHQEFDRQLGPVRARAEGGLGPLIGYSNDGISIGFYGDVGLAGGVGNYGGGFAVGGGWSVTFSSAASCAAQ